MGKYEESFDLADKLDEFTAWGRLTPYQLKLIDWFQGALRQRLDRSNIGGSVVTGAMACSQVDSAIDL